MISFSENQLYKKGLFGIRLIIPMGEMLIPGVSFRSDLLCKLWLKALLRRVILYGLKLS